MSPLSWLGWDGKWCSNPSNPATISRLPAHWSLNWCATRRGFAESVAPLCPQCGVVLHTQLNPEDVIVQEGAIVGVNDEGRMYFIMCTLSWHPAVRCHEAVASLLLLLLLLLCFSLSTFTVWLT